MSVKFRREGDWIVVDGRLGKRLSKYIKYHIPENKKMFDYNINRWKISADIFADVNAFAPKPKQDSKADVYAVLHLLPSAPLALVKAAYRELSRAHHPDVGGDADTMSAINDAYEKIKKSS